MALLEVENLQTHFRTDDGTVRAVDGVTFSVDRGETLGIVGESGSGKSVTNLSLLRLIPEPPGKIVGGQARFDGRDLLTMSEPELRQIRGHKVAMIFQDPMTSLNPFLTVADQLMEVTRLHLGYSREQAYKHAIEMLERVGIPAADRRVNDYPHQFSGGMRQRVMIAMALSCEPDVLIADEPTTALDVTIQAQILDLMKDLQREKGTAIIMVTHDLGVIANICQRVNVMYAGRIVEEAPVHELFEQPLHPYTMGLLHSVPRLDETKREHLDPIEGQPPDLTQLPSGCAFAPRCRWAEQKCQQQVPPLFQAGGHRKHACVVQQDGRLTGEGHVPGVARG